MPELGYRVFLPDGMTHTYIGFSKWSFQLQENNTRVCPCKNCHCPIPTREGIYRKIHGDSGFWCLTCVKAKIMEFKELGFTQTLIYNLQCCFMHHGRYTAQEVADGIRLMGAPVKFEVTFIGERKGLRSRVWTEPPQAAPP